MLLCHKAVRLLALLSTDASSEPALRSAPWLPFLRDAAASDDCTLASDAGRALLNMRSAAAAAAETSAPTPAAKCATLMSLSRHQLWLTCSVELLIGMQAEVLELFVCRSLMGEATPFKSHQHVCKEPPLN